MLRRLLLSLFIAAATACDHSQPFEFEGTDPHGPFPRDSTTPLIQRLTFNTGDDRTPSVAGDEVVFSRLEPARSDGDRCIAFLPVIGGTLSRTECAGAAADTVRHAWLRPVVSPDGARIAYVAEESSAFRTPIAPRLRNLVVAAIDNISQAIVIPHPINTTDGVVGDFRELEWVNSETLRFIGGIGSFNGFTRDTVFTSLGLFEWNITTGSVPRIEGVTNPIAHTRAPDGGIWFVSQPDSTVIFHLPAGATSAVPLFFDWTSISLTPVTMWDIDNFDGLPVVAANVLINPLADIQGRILVLDFASGSASAIWRDNRPRSFAKVPGMSAIVIDVIDGAGANLWLAEAP